MMLTILSLEIGRMPAANPSLRQSTQRLVVEHFDLETHGFAQILCSGAADRDGSAS